MKSKELKKKKEQIALCNMLCLLKRNDTKMLAGDSFLTSYMLKQFEYPIYLLLHHPQLMVACLIRYRKPDHLRSFGFGQSVRKPYVAGFVAAG